MDTEQLCRPTCSGASQRRRASNQAYIDRVSAAGAKTQQVEYGYDAFDQLTGKRVSTQFNPSGTPTNWSRYEVFAWADGQEVFRFVDSDGQERKSITSKVP